MEIIFTVPRRIQNSDDALHCVQAAFSMTVESLTNARVDNDLAEKLTGFTAGVETWPYRMLAWFAENGFEVEHIDALDPVAFIESPRTELERCNLDSETIDYYFQITDFEAEGVAIRRCIKAGVKFSIRIPEKLDLTRGLKSGWLPVVALDAAALTQEVRDGFQGHTVLITGFDAENDRFLVQDSGPPARWDWEVTGDQIVKSMRSIAETSGTITLVRRPAARLKGGATVELSEQLASEASGQGLDPQPSG
ncbi:hypothetical protein [Antrihabitans stalactiti]|uniref:Peptidase C39-like domain-containing protein n=1 Tax=Antrihabitans stalactiti TaxID=2584121 RepID=A0A848KHF9_9NOCA|nr:hypothetical protein [Antrihabitans stalactiti]NMN98463.1 hypothetical protein [Antrihabitans stalactiti]